jgi:CBS domain containing-hemolysin-like protein
MELSLGTIVLQLLSVAVLVALNGFFVAAEFALVKVRQTQLEPLIARGQRRAQIVRRVVQNLDASLSACQLGITLASLGLGWIGEPVFATLLGPLMTWLQIDSPEIRHSLAFLVGFTVITFLHISAGEQAPKWLAIQRPLPVSLWVAQPLTWFRQVSHPFIWVLNHASLWMVRKMGVEPSGETEGRHTEEEIRLLVATTEEQSGRSGLGRSIVLNALDLRRRVAREVMRPRHEIVGLSTEATLAECLELAERTRYSRFPLCEAGDLDRTLGVVHIKDLYALRTRARTAADLRSAARKLIYVPPSAALEKLLGLFLERRLHLAMVVDEYGGTAGMVTLENILEELVGQIQDEFDQEKPLVQSVGENVWELSGALPLHEFSSLVGEALEHEEIATLSGWITHQLGGFPAVGSQLQVGQHDLHVESLEGLRVGRVRLTRTPTVAATEPSA